ncbi:MAG: ParB N-terminal domain-containing protein, partial [Ardenticatenaceae bacterium]
PVTDSALAKHPKVIATPHIAASTDEAQINAAISIAEQINRYLRMDGSVAATLSLQMVPMELVIPHEAVDAKRVTRLAASLEKEGMLVNPPLVAEYQGKYIVLDGATRTSAFSQLGIPHLVVQVADPNKDDVALHTWYHVVSGPSAEALLQELKQIPGLKLSQIPASDVHSMLREGSALANIALEDGRFFHAEVAGEGHDRLDVLNQMVARYTLWGDVARTLTSDLDQLRATYTDMAALIVFPQFQPEEALQAAIQGKTLPQGITRFIIPGRVLRLNVPLEILSTSDPLASKRRWLDQYVHDKLNRQRVRYYHEPVILLED